MGWLDVRERTRSGQDPGPVVGPLRRVWVVVASWAMLAAGFMLEPLLALGPGVVALLTTEVAPLAIVGLVLFAGFRLARGAVRRLRRPVAAEPLWTLVSVSWVAVLPWTARFRVD